MSIAPAFGHSADTKWRCLLVGLMDDLGLDSNELSDEIYARAVSILRESEQVWADRDLVYQIDTTYIHQVLDQICGDYLFHSTEE